MNDEVGYVSPADFDAPAIASAGVKPQDELNLSTMEEVVYYLDKEIAEYSGIKRLKIKDDNGFTVEQQLAINQSILTRLEIIRDTIIDTMEGIRNKYDESD